MGIAAVFGGPTFAGDAAQAYLGALDDGKSDNEAIDIAVRAGEAQNAREQAEWDALWRKPEPEVAASKAVRPGRWMLVKLFLGIA